MSENKSEYEIREENRIRNEEWARKVLGYPSIADPEPNKNSNRLDNWDKSTLKPGSFLKDPTPQTKEEIKNKISSEIQTADVKIDPKEGKKLAEALQSKDLDKATALINSMDLSEKPQYIKPINEFDKKEAQQFADALKSNDPKKIEELIKHTESKKEFNQTADYKFDKKEAQQFADALKSKDISKIPHTISKEESKELLEKVGTEKSSLNKLLAQSGQQLDMETLNNAMETSNIQQNKSSQER